MKTLGVALTLLAVGIVGSLIFGIPTQAAPNNPGPTVTVANVPLPVTGTVTGTFKDANAGKYTHVGQMPGNIVNLSLYGELPPTRFDPVTFDPATGGETTFQIPVGFMFVLTDVQGTAACIAGSSVSFEIRQAFPPSVDVLRDTGELVCSSAGHVSFERHYTTGLLFGPGTRPLAPIGAIQNVEIHGEGYLIPY